MKFKTPIAVFLFFSFMIGCSGTSENNIILHLKQDTETISNKSLNFTLSIYSNSEVGTRLSVHEDLKDTLMMHSGSWLNLCKTPSFYLNERKSDVTEVYVSKNSPYNLNISADYSFDEVNKMHILDFGDLGRICRDQQNTKINLYFKFYEANISILEGLLYDKSDGVLSNKIEIK